MARKEKVFTNKKRRVYRKVITNGEVIFGACFVVIVALMTLWVASTHDNYDPGERDISMAVMESSAVEDNLYRTPLQRWIDPQEVQADAPAAARTYRLGVFPQSILDGNWTPSTRLQQFNESNLFEKINGAAPQYFQYGFRALHFLGISKDGSDLEINIELYDMAELPNAIGIFSAQRDDSQKLENVDNRAHYYLTPAGALGLVENFYFKISGNSNSPEIQEKAVSLVKALAEIDAGGGPPPKMYVVLNQRLGIPFERIRFEKQDAFQYDFARNFWFARPENSQGLRLYAHEAPSAEDTDALFEQLLENHLFDFTMVEQSPSNAILKHNFLGTLLSLSKSGNFIYGVEDAPDEQVLQRASASLSEALFDDE